LKSENFFWTDYLQAPIQVQGDMTQKLGQISKIQPESCKNVSKKDDASVEVAKEVGVLVGCHELFAFINNFVSLAC